MFAPDAAKTFGERFVCMDIDCLVTGPLDPLFDRDNSFCIYRGTAPGRPYNGSMMLLAAGARPQVYEKFNLTEAEKAGQKYIGSDQAWLSYILGPNETTWGVGDGVRWWNRLRREKPPSDTRVMFFPGHIKPWEFATNGLDPWVAERYCRSPQQGRCLILGYAESVWDEAAEALDTHSFDAVIASPEAAEHWPGDILAIANNDEHALRLSWLHGFTEGTFCGATSRSLKIPGKEIAMTTMISSGVH
jgi:hypothetical protein